jgi:hypothetical protein
MKNGFMSFKEGYSRITPSNIGGNILGMFGITARVRASYTNYGDHNVKLWVLTQCHYAHDWKSSTYMVVDGRELKPDSSRTAPEV